MGKRTHTSKPDEDAARQLLAQAKAARVERCKKALDELLAKERCSLRASVQTAQGGAIPVNQILHPSLVVGVEIIASE